MHLSDGRSLMEKGDDLWVVIGGGDKGGIVAREQMDPNSPVCPERLSTGSVVRANMEDSTRLAYVRLTGTGPATGGVSKKLEKLRVDREFFRVDREFFRVDP